MSYKNKKILGIITARAGSKGLPNKNILSLGNKPLIAWTILEANKSKYLDRTILSTDSEIIAKIAKEFNCEVPFIRPEELAKDTSTSLDVILHVLTNVTGFDYFVLLQPTSPFRIYDDIDSCIQKCIDETAPSCVSVEHSHTYPQLIYSIDSNYKLTPILTNENQTRRQDMKSFFSLNGAVYVVDINAFKMKNKFIFEESNCYIMPRERSIDIDDAFDFSFAEFLLTRKA